MKKTDVRLPVHVKPLRYKIILRPNFDDFTFYGEETVSLSLDKPVKEITLHANELEVEDVKLVHKGEEWVGKISHERKNELVKFTFPKSFAGKGELWLVFKGLLNDKMHGFYRSKYTVDGVEKFLATTQFESTDARCAFPCIDEPAIKAIFDVTLMIPAHMMAISNTLPSVVSEHEQGYKVVQFEPTPKMSTYLLAFIVGEFDWVETKTKEGVTVRVFTTPGKKEQAKFALEIASKMLSFYNDYFDFPYPLPVLDLIAIPDFAAGAMENWGAVTYRETALLIDPEHSSASNRQRVAIVIAHELAHQWFGNLVTMEWWTHLWLNEGFASYIEYLATDHVFPQWDIWTQFLYSDQGIALKLDGLKNTHPIEVEVGHPSEIDEIFDKVSYSKGASIIRMLANYLGEKDFRDGLRHYLKKHSYANAKTENLWEAFEHVSGKPIKKIMANWTAKAGYPILRLTEGKRSLNVSQSRFFSSTHSKKSTKDATLWSIPLKTLKTGARSDSLLMGKKSIKLKKPKGGEWIKLNVGESSFVRVDYPEKFLKLLEQPLKDQKLSPLDRLGIIRDVFDLAESGDTPTHQALELALSYVNEADFTVWMELTAHLSQIESLIAKEKFESMFNPYGLMVYKTVAKKLGWGKKKAEKHTDTLLRSIALYKLGSFGDKEVIKEAQERFAQRDIKKIDPDLRLMIYKLAAQNGGQKEFNIFKKMHRQESLQQEKDRITAAMASFKQTEILKATLEFVLSDEVRLQDAIFIITEVVSNPKGRDLAWRFIKRHWKVINERYGSLKFMMPRLIDSLDGFISQADARNIEAFFKKNPIPAAKRTIQQTLEQIYSNASWLSRDRKGIRKFLENSPS